VTTHDACAIMCLASGRCFKRMTPLAVPGWRLIWQLTVVVLFGDGNDTRREVLALLWFVLPRMAL
jgi:hypothetical protein